MKEAKLLLEKYRRGECTPEEKQLLQKWFHHLNEDERSELTEDDLQKAFTVMESNMRDLTRVPHRINWISIAAAILIFISFGIYYWSNIYQPAPESISLSKQYDISPGGNIATLTLADGRKISLTDAENGELAEQSGIQVTKTADGQLLYTVTGLENSSHSLLYNTIETPPGGQYQINLPDGSRVWLNSSSSLHYPVRFTGKERKVEITGEAYFEVAHNKDMPFKVVSDGQTVEVLGTHFNIMAYPDESSTKTTLLEGSVRVTKENKSTVISPGQQARLKDGNINVIAVDTKEVTAWKDGYFIFKSEDIQSIMRQISRWYNAEVEYQGDISGKVFGGRISRSRNVSEVLKILELTGSIHFKVIPGDSEGKERRIIVMP